MRINGINGKEADVTLTADELGVIGNLIYFYEEHHEPDDGSLNARFHELGAQVIIARDLCHYGHLDDHSLKMIIKHKAAVRPEHYKGIMIPEKEGEHEGNRKADQHTEG